MTNLPEGPTGWCPFAVDKPITQYAYGTIHDRNTIVLHITEGPTAAGAIEWFRQSKVPNRISAHFVIDRDGTIYQLVSINDTAWHASQCNSRSIGIEHVAVSSGPDKAGLPVTYDQYIASAMLIKWLAEQMGIPIDRNHIRTHNEASPADHHTLCCTGALDPDKLVALAQK